MNVLVTGDACKIGSHTCRALLEAAHSQTVLHNSCNSSGVALQHVLELAGTRLSFICGDMRNCAEVQLAFSGDVEGPCWDAHER